MRAHILPVILMAWAGAAFSQDAPRPPERPTPLETTLPARDQFGPVWPGPSAEPMGPPAPPHHLQLRESDQDFDACLLALNHLGTRYETLPAIAEPDTADCGIARPVKVMQIIPGVELEGGALMRCSTARALAFWTQDYVRPAAATLPGSPRLTGMQLGTTYDCRARIGTGAESPPMSEHAFGNAIDIMGFSFDNGETLPVQPRHENGDVQEGFQRAVRSTACLWFTTVMGPGSNAAHDDHLHFDVIARNSGWRLCD